MAYWSWYVGGIGLAAILVGHWLILRRMMAVSGRFTALINRARFGSREDEGAELSQAELVAAMRAATEAAFGAAAMELPEPASTRAPPSERTLEDDRRAAPTPRTHALFLAALIAGGLVSSLLRGSFGATVSLKGELFARVTQGSPIAQAALLFGGGLLVGVGTRMAGGCTSGHGLCGLSRFQKGSLVATVAFFATGVGTSLLLGRLL
jgi:uncharacterized membrane protein YedE/YeeE